MNLFFKKLKRLHKTDLIHKNNRLKQRIKLIRINNNLELVIMMLQS